MSFIFSGTKWPGDAATMLVEKAVHLHLGFHLIEKQEHALLLAQHLFLTAPLLRSLTIMKSKLW